MNVVTRTLVAIAEVITNEGNVSAARHAFDKADGDLDQRLRAALLAARSGTGSPKSRRWDCPTVGDGLPVPWGMGEAE